MMRTLLTALLVAATAAVATGDDKDTKAPAGDLAKMQGKWKAKGGPNKDYTIVMVIEGSRVHSTITTPEGKDILLNGEVKLDESAKPKRLDWIKFARPDGGDFDPNPAIYELEGDTLKVCQGGPGGERPAEFKAPEGERIVLLEFRRQKDEDTAEADLKKVQGQWSGIIEGGDTTIHLEIKDKTATVTFTDAGEERKLGGGVRLDATKSPKHWDWVDFDTPDGGKADRPAIYKLEGDELTICSGGPNGERPTEFKGADMGPPILIKFRRKS